MITKSNIQMHSENLLENTLTFTFLHNVSSVLSAQKL